MEDIEDLAERFEVKPPSTIIVGRVVNILLGENYGGEDDEIVAEEEMGRGGRGQ